MSKINRYLLKSTLSEDICKKIISLYDDKLIPMRKTYRSQKIYHETNTQSWLCKIIDKLIKENLNDNYQLLQRVTILKYEPGDYFAKHTDGEWNTLLTPNLPNHFYGGIELSKEDSFIGGEFEIEENVNIFKQGRIFTHEFDDLHEVKKVIKGVRWALHFLIRHNHTPRII